MQSPPKPWEINTVPIGNTPSIPPTVGGILTHPGVMDNSILGVPVLNHPNPTGSVAAASTSVSVQPLSSSSSLGGGGSSLPLYNNYNYPSTYSYSLPGSTGILSSSSSPFPPIITPPTYNHSQGISSSLYPPVVVDGGGGIQPLYSSYNHPFSSSSSSINNPTIIGPSSSSVTQTLPLYSSTYPSSSSSSSYPLPPSYAPPYSTSSSSFFSSPYYPAVPSSSSSYNYYGGNPGLYPPSPFVTSLQNLQYVIQNIGSLFDSLGMNVTTFTHTINSATTLLQIIGQTTGEFVGLIRNPIPVDPRIRKYQITRLFIGSSTVFFVYSLLRYVLRGRRNKVLLPTGDTLTGTRTGGTTTSSFFRTIHRLQILLFIVSGWIGGYHFAQRYRNNTGDESSSVNRRTAARNVDSSTMENTTTTTVVTPVTSRREMIRLPPTEQIINE